jgi:predicted transcriptional regulator
VKYRNTQEIICNVLECTESSIKVGDLIRKTNTNHTKIKKFLGKLIDCNLIVSFENNYLITENGRKYLESYKKFSTLSESFGLEL